MNYWLLKTEPETFSWENLISDGVSMWDGVRNYQARNNLRSMKTGDKAFIYYSGKNPGVIGIAEVVKEHYPDPTATEGDWSVIEIKPIKKLKRFIPLNEIKLDSNLSEMVLLKNSRLSVQPLKSGEFNYLSGLD
jgi:predicted RNA-binding protein with PUA-like domain